MTTVQSLGDLFRNELQRAYAMESRLLEAMPELEADVGKDATDDVRESDVRERLLEALTDHRAETETHVERLETTLRTLDRSPSERSTPALDGLLEQRQTFNNVVLNDEIRPVYYVDVAKQLEHLEITTYERLVDLASHLDLPAEASDPIEETLQEELAMLERLQDLRDSGDFEQLVTTLETEPGSR